MAYLWSGAQTPSEVSSSEAKEHALKHPDPVYPAIAKAAQVQGDVVLLIVIDTNGHVTGVKPISGPPMLIGSATDAVKQWQYAPFETGGSPVEVSTKVTLPFYLGPTDPNDTRVAQEYFPLSKKCVQLVSQRADPAEEVSACQQAAAAADQFAKSARDIERRSAYVYYTTALIRDKRATEAVAVGEKAIAVVLQGHDDGSGSSAAYSVAAQAKAQSGDLTGADKDLEVAEDYQRKALDSPAGHALSKEYSHGLKSMLDFHAQILSAMGKDAEAHAKTEEASKL
jgi:TonB family protein